MTPEIAGAIAIIAAVLGVLSFFNNNKKDATNSASEVASMKEQIKNMQAIINMDTIQDIKAIQQAITALNSRVDKMDNDVMKIIDNISGKVDKILLVMSKVSDYPIK